MYYLKNLIIFSFKRFKNVMKLQIKLKVKLKSFTMNSDFSRNIIAIWTGAVFDVN